MPLQTEDVEATRSASVLAGQPATNYAKLHLRTGADKAIQALFFFRPEDGAEAAGWIARRSREWGDAYAATGVRVSVWRRDPAIRYADVITE